MMSDTNPITPKDVKLEKPSSMLKYYFGRTLALLRAKPAIGGLEISDTAIRFASYDGDVWKFISAKIPPGLMEMNRIKNRDEFIKLVKNFRAQILGEEQARRKAKINVVVSLSSISIYSQVFGLPIVRGENLEKAVQLNIQMVSPVEVKEAYSGWQLVGEDKDTFRLEVLSAFIDRKVVDDMTQVLEEGGFTPVAIESRALAIARLARKKGSRIDITKPYIIIHLDSAGLDFLIIRNGQLYFEYFHSWKDVQNEKQQITQDAFEALLTRSLYQVFNFYSQHWPDPVRDVLISAVALQEQVEKVISKNFGLSAQPLVFEGSDKITPEWFVALGSGMRGLIPRREDKDISLLGVGAQERFRQEQIMDFISFWRVTIPIVVSILLITFVSADMFLINLRRSLESQAVFQLKQSEVREIETLRGQAERFNRTVAMIQTAQKSIRPKEPLFEKMADLFTQYEITINRINFQGGDVPVSLSGEAPTESSILDLKKALDADSEISSVQLPLTDIKKSSGKGFSFSLSFGAKLQERND
ncbi:MAG: hypothetical protein NUV53_01350 [Patescibacteria group bacterium]|nr:hypothetical protein [Patescibacteria group bacterium]